MSAQPPPGPCQAQGPVVPPCSLLSLAAFVYSLLPAQPAPCPHWCPCQSSIPQAWLHLLSRDGAGRPQQPHGWGIQWVLGLWPSPLQSYFLLALSLLP